MFPTCSEPGLEIVRALIDQPGMEIVGGSSLPPSQDPSSLILRHHVTIPWLGAGEFHDALMNILRDYSIQVVFPATDSLIAALSRTDMGDVVLVAPSPDVSEICLSKLKTYERLEGVVPVPRVYEDDGEVEFPAYAKPLEEAGMRGHMQVNDPEDLRIARKRDLLVTEFLPGEEYEVNCLSDLQGSLLYANIRRLGRRVGGHVLDSQSLEDEDMTTNVEAIAAELRIEGPWFAQFKRDRQGRPVLIEVNARIGGGSGLNRFGGVNLPLAGGQAVHGAVDPEADREQACRRNAVPAILRKHGTHRPGRLGVAFPHPGRRKGQPATPWPASSTSRIEASASTCSIPPGWMPGTFLKEAEIPCFFEEILPYGEEGQGGWVAALTACAVTRPGGTCSLPTGTTRLHRRSGSNFRAFSSPPRIHWRYSAGKDWRSRRQVTVPVPACVPVPDQLLTQASPNGNRKWSGGLVAKG